MRRRILVTYLCVPVRREELRRADNRRGGIKRCDSRHESFFIQQCPSEVTTEMNSFFIQACTSLFHSTVVAQMTTQSTGSRSIQSALLQQQLRVSISTSTYMSLHAIRNSGPPERQRRAGSAQYVCCGRVDARRFVGCCAWVGRAPWALDSDGLMNLYIYIYILKL
jgi:hypothetical protein